MKAFLFSLCYNILYTVGWLVTLPSYLLKQKRRGGFGTGFWSVSGCTGSPITGSRKGCYMCMP